MLKGFKEFILRGNVVDMAVGVVIGAAFASLVNAFTKDLLTPLISAIAGKPQVAAISFTLNHSVFAVGDFINEIVAFLLTASAVYFFVVAPLHALLERLHKLEHHGAAAVATRKCPECLSDAPAAARRCSHCAQPLTPVA